MYVYIKWNTTQPLKRIKFDTCSNMDGLEGYWRQWRPTPVLLLGKSLGRRSLVGCSPWGRWGLDTTERLHFRFSLSCIGEGNGNPLQCSCLENPRDGEAWRAPVYGVTQSQTRLKWLSRIMLDRERQIIYVITHIWNLKKYNKLMNITKSRLRETKLVVTSGEREGGRGKIPVGV